MRVPVAGLQVRLRTAISVYFTLLFCDCLCTVPPSIVDAKKSSMSDVVAQEGDTVTLWCMTSGTPTPQVTWYQCPDHARRACSASSTDESSTSEFFSGVFCRFLESTLNSLPELSNSCPWRDPSDIGHAYGPELQICDVCHRRR